MGIYDHDVAAADVFDAPGISPQEKDVAGVAFDCKILVKRTDRGAVFIVDHDAIAGDLRNGAAASNGGQAGTFSCLYSAVDPIAVQIGAPASALRLHSCPEQCQH